MGLLKSIFGKKDDNSFEISVDIEPTSSKATNPPIGNASKAKFHLKGYPDANGLYPSELVMLSVAERYKTTQTDFPGYLTYSYEITNPRKMLKTLNDRGYIEPGSAIDTLSIYKVSEFKEIASKAGISVKGKKADILSQLSEAGEDAITEFIKERKWKLTESGKAEIKANPYISYFLDKHEYDLGTVGIDLWTVNKELTENPKQLYRDVIFRLLNLLQFNTAVSIQTNPNGGSADTHTYCECFRLMGLFVEEEGRSYVTAADYYFQYLYKRINIHAGLQLLTRYKLYKQYKDLRSDGFDEFQQFYDDIHLYPFNRTEILRLIDECELSEDEVRDALITSFKRAKDSGIMSEEEAADFIILELSGEVDKSKEFAVNSARRAVKKIR